MKLRKILAMSIVALCAVACNDDKTASFAETVSGTYKGSMALSVMGNSMDPMDMEVTITPESDATVGITLTGDPDATGGMSIKSIGLEGVGVSTADGSVYTLAKAIGGDGYTAQDSGTSVNWKFTLVEGSVTGDAASLKLVGQPGAMPMAITMDFKGTK